MKPYVVFLGSYYVKTNNIIVTIEIHTIGSRAYQTIRSLFCLCMIALYYLHVWSTKSTEVAECNYC